MMPQQTGPRPGSESFPLGTAHHQQTVSGNTVRTKLRRLQHFASHGLYWIPPDFLHPHGAPPLELHQMQRPRPWEPANYTRGMEKHSLTSVKRQLDALSAGAEHHQEILTKLFQAIGSG